MTQERQSVDEFKTPPQLQKSSCKLMAICLRLFLQFFSAIATIVAWYIYGYFAAAATLALSFIFMGIIRSKLKNSVIPPQQLEHIYTDKEIAHWYIAKRICF
jgi:hypothetical protein